MPYYVNSPLDVGLGAAGALLQSQQAKKQQDLLNKQAEEQIRQQAALAAAQQATENRRISDQESAEKFQEGLYAPGQYQTITTQGKYTQAHPGHPKGSPKTMTRQQLIPNTGGIEWQKDQAAIAASAANAALNRARIPKEEALAIYYATKPGMEAKREIDRMTIAANALKARLGRGGGGKGTGLTDYQRLEIQHQYDALNAQIQEKQTALEIAAQNHADTMTMIQGMQNPGANLPPVQPAAVPSFVPYPYPVMPGQPNPGQPAPPQSAQQTVQGAMQILNDTPPSGRQAVFSKLPYSLQLQLRAQGVTFQVSK